MNKQYIGDGVYVEWNGTHIVLTTEGNVIYIEPEVWDSLLTYVTKITKQQKEKK